MRTPYPRPQYITLPTLLLLMLQRTKGETEALAPLTHACGILNSQLEKCLHSCSALQACLAPINFAALQNQEMKKKNQRRHQSGSGETVQKHKGSPHENRHPPESPTKTNKEVNDLQSPLQQQRSFLVYPNP
jgi:hypothetical protein